MNKEENIDYKAISNYSLPELYKLLDISLSFDGTGAVPEIEKGDEEKGRNRFMAMLRRFKIEICQSSRLKNLLEDKKNTNRLEIAAVVSDLLLSYVTPLAAFTFGLIITKSAYSEICY